jgi:hypothetical protein
VITPTPVIYTKSLQLPAANYGIYAKQIGDIAGYRAVGAVSWPAWPAPRFLPPPSGRQSKSETEAGRSKGKGPASSRPLPIITADGELPLRHDGRRRWRLAFAVVLGIGGDAEESEHRSR